MQMQPCSTLASLLREGSHELSYEAGIRAYGFMRQLPLRDSAGLSPGFPYCVLNIRVLAHLKPRVFYYGREINTP